jgi:hypothetical protein
MDDFQSVYGSAGLANQQQAAHAQMGQMGLAGRALAPEPTVHLFEGAPRTEAKNAPCGAAIVRPGRVAGFTLTGLHATTEVDYVTCLGCLRALIPAKGK